MCRDILGLALLSLTIATSLFAQDSQSRVLIVFGHNPNAPGAFAFSQNLKARFIEKGTPAVEFFGEAIDYDRFPDRGRWPQLARSFADKYRNDPLTAIVAEGSSALIFSAEYLRTHFPDVPILYGNTFDPIVDYDGLPANVTGRRQVLGFVETLELAKRLQPDAERVVLIGGSSPLDSVLFNTAVRDLQPHLDRMRLATLQDWTYPTLLRTVRHFPARTIVILSSFRRDLAGYVFSSGDLIASLTNNSSAPVYGVARNWVKDGVVGGAVLDFPTEGSETARLLESVLRRKPGTPLPPPEIAINPHIVDWRQLQRWGFSEAALPSGTQVLFRTPTFWEKNRFLILVTAAVILAQLVLIVLLLLERTRRQRAQRVVEETRGQVTHIARVATAGQITGAVSHELRQPLTAIHLSAQAGEMLLSQPNPDLTEAREIFRSIVSADERAVELIDHIRGLLRTDNGHRELVDMNHVSGRCVQLMRREASGRGVQLDTKFDPNLSNVRGDAVQLQQVCMNLIMNALDAAGSNGGGRSVILGTREGLTEVEIYVRNSGGALSKDVQRHLFDAFFSTKSNGLGMGLAIVRMIVDRHQGVVSGRNHPEGGVVFSVVLPKV